MKISTLLATKGGQVVTVGAGQTLAAAAGSLARNQIGALIVLDETGGLTGILSERDLVRVAAAHDGVLVGVVADAMTRVVITGAPQDDLRSVLQTMTERRFRHLPILDHGQLAGIISIGDVIKAQLDEYEGEIQSLHQVD
jgi:CBS domain-containing protein